MTEMPDSKTWYITTPIYYVNGLPHVGTALTTVACDVLARYQRLRGRRTRLLTGTDENGAKVLEAAEQAGTEVRTYVDRLAASFEQAWTDLHVGYDDFIRTSEPRHTRAVQTFFSRLAERGWVYKDVYEGWYSVSDETFLRDADVEYGVAKETGKPVTRVKEENWFFKLSAFSDRLLKHIDQHPDFLLPEFRRNEVIRFIEDGLRDMCITRANRGWGIPFPGDESHVIYVWFDALISYLAATGWPEREGWQEIWPADVHFMGKEIFVRFHATLWPAMLMALDLPLPRQEFGHGFWTIPGLRPGEKAGKSTGGLPHPSTLSSFIEDRTGLPGPMAADVLRYMLCREMNFGLDTEFTVEGLLRRYNTDLANDLGNLVNRTLNMVDRYFGGRLERYGPDPEWNNDAAGALDRYETAFAAFRLNEALEAALELVARANKYIDDQAPWTLARKHASGDAESGARLETVLSTCLEAARVAAILLTPFMPVAVDAIRSQLAISPEEVSWQSARWGSRSGAVHTAPPNPIFPRIQDLEISQEDRQRLASPPAADVQTLKQEETCSVETTSTGGGATPAAPSAPATGPISIEEFARVELQVGEVLAAEPVPNADKLLRLTVDLGGEDTRTILAGIAQFYQPDALVGRQVVVVSNLQPRKMRGIESQGMLLAADVDGRAILLHPDQAVPAGSRVR